MTKNNTQAGRYQASALSATRIHFYLLGAYGFYIVISDAWNLITPDLALQRWTATGLFLAVSVLVWYVARSTGKSSNFYKSLLYILILSDIVFATFNVYTQRGMASRAVMLYALPILIATMLLSRAAIFTAATLSVAAYIMAVYRYFVVHPGEGYRVELYAEAYFYCALIFVIAALLWANLKPKQ